MRLLKIKIKNINCLRCDWIIDFQSPPLLEAGLFAITGPTGAGKSTILDAITLALFNEIPRFDAGINRNIIEKTGSVLTRNENECYVEVEYSCTKGRFRSKWDISKGRTGKFRNYNMEITDLNTNKVLDVKRSQIPAKNEELIGLKYEQFLRSILLSQGEFSKFLKSKKSERGQLLEDITGMQIYSIIGKKAFEIFKEKNEAIKFKSEQLEYEKTQLLNDESLLKLHEEISSISNSIEAEESQLNATRQLIERKVRIKQIEKEISNYQIELKNIQQKQQDFNSTKKELIEKHEKLLPSLKDIRLFFTEKKNVEDLKKEFKEEEIRLTQEKVNQAEIVKNVGVFIKKETWQETLVEDINHFRETASILLETLHREDTAFNLLQKRITAIVSKAAFKSYQLQYDSNTKLFQIINKEIHTSGEQLKASFKTYRLSEESIESRKKEIDERATKLIELKGWVEQYTSNTKRRTETFNNHQDTQTELNTKIPECKPLENEIVELQLQIEQLEKEVLKQTLLSSSNVELLRKQLKEDEPCPVCGAIHHPYSNEFVEVLKEIKTEYDNTKLTKSKKDEALSILQREIEKSKINLTHYQKQINELDEEINTIKISIDSCRTFLKLEKVGSVQLVKDLIQKNDEQKNAISELEKLLAKASLLIELRDELDKWIMQERKVNEAKDNLKNIYQENSLNEDCDQWLNQISSINNNINKYASNYQRISDTLEGKNKLLKNLSLKIGERIKLFGYTNVEEVKKDILEDALFNKYINERSDIEAEKKRISSLINAAENRKTEQCENDDPLITLDGLEYKFEKIKNNLIELRQNEKNKLAEQNVDEQKRGIIKLLIDEIGSVKKANYKWELLAKYIGDAQGKNFSTFAQGLTLSKLMMLANVHLKNLNDRYLLDIPKEEEDDDLTVIDQYLGEERRSIKTLSGGETFIASLALALALSDLASRNVKIESLFIDEGFGSLDLESLDLAISTLERLQIQSNKTMGIISHVDSLKERISTQIQLEKGSNGFSKLKITTI